MGYSVFRAGVSSVLILTSLATIAASARPPVEFADLSPFSRQKKWGPSRSVTRVQLRAALLDARAAKKAYLSSKKQAKALVALARKPGASRDSKRAAVRAVATLRANANQLKAALATLRRLRNQSRAEARRPANPAAGKPAKPAVQKGVKRAVQKEVQKAVQKEVKKAVQKEVKKVVQKAAKKAVQKAAKRAVQKPIAAGKKSAVITSKPKEGKGPAVTKKQARARVVPLVKNADKKMSKKMMKMNGRRLPMNCFCAKQRVGESRCYYFIKGRTCRARTCSASYKCVGREQSRGILCLLRRVQKRIVPFRGSICRIRRIDSFMYVPYARY